MVSIRFFGKVLLALILGISCAFVVIQHDERFLDIVHEKVAAVFKDQYGARFCAEACSINPFFLSATFTNVRVEHIESTYQWLWSAEFLTVHCSLWSLLYSRAVGITFALKNLQANTRISFHMIDIIDHIQRILSAPQTKAPIRFDGISLQNVNLSFYDEKYSVVGFLQGAAVAERVGNDFITTAQLIDGTIKKLDLTYIKNVLGSVVIVSELQSALPHITFDCSFSSPQFPDDDRYVCSIKGSWDGDQGSGMMQTKDHSLLIHPCNVTKKDDEYLYNGKLTIEADLLKRLVYPSLQEKIEGVCEFALDGSSLGDVEGMCIAKQIEYKGFVCDTATFSFTKELDDVHGTLTSDFGQRSIEGAVDYSLKTKSGTYELKNSSKIALCGLWEIPACQATCSGEFSLTGQHHAEYGARAQHSKTEEEVIIDGTLVQKDGAAFLRGSLASQFYTIELATDPFMVRSAVYTDRKNNNLLHCEFSDPSHFTATMDYETVRTFVRSWYDSFLPGKGECIITGVCSKEGVTGTLEISKALIRLPAMYNFISDGSLSYRYDRAQNFFICNNVVFNLHKGRVLSKQLTIRLPFDQKALFIHMPLNFYHCFINAKKHLYGTLTGSLLYLKKDDNAKISGFCVIENMNIKDNIFSSELYNSFGGPGSHKKKESSLYATRLAIDVSSQKPAVVSTPVFETEAQFRCFIKNTVEDPVVEGRLSLRGGEIMFPAHSLNITRGEIAFLPYLNNSHLLDIVAEGRIKKYLVTLMIGGSLQDPTITFQSNPSLTQEQIILLLFGGTEEQSLNVMAPALVMYNAQNFLLSESSQYETIKNSLIPAWFQPFQRVNFIPRFTDQTGRGGLKGVLEVEVNDRLRASIEKNFSLSENASAEVEYLLSDDVSLKISKDDRGDVGAEMEMRFKF